MLRSVTNTITSSRILSPKRNTLCLSGLSRKERGKQLCTPRLKEQPNSAPTCATLLHAERESRRILSRTSLNLREAAISAGRAAPRLRDTTGSRAAAALHAPVLPVRRRTNRPALPPRGGQQRGPSTPALPGAGARAELPLNHFAAGKRREAARSLTESQATMSPWGFAFAPRSCTPLQGFSQGHRPC